MISQVAAGTTITWGRPWLDAAVQNCHGQKVEHCTRWVRAFVERVWFPLSYKESLSACCRVPAVHAAYQYSLRCGSGYTHTFTGEAAHQRITWPP